MEKIGIFGFGRIGRSVVRAALSRNLFVPVVIADIRDPKNFAALFRYDTNFGVWPEEVDFRDGVLRIGDRDIAFVDSSAAIPDWKKEGVEVVVDCSALSTRRSGATKHLDAGALKVLVSAASKTRDDADAFLLRGVNTGTYDPGSHHIVSMASCTTNALAPVVKVIRERFGIVRGFFVTVHSYTSTQSLCDQPMDDRRDSWAAAENIIPSSSGAAKALKYIWPDLDVTGKSYRVPTRTGSIVDLVVETKRKTSVDEVNELFRTRAGESEYRGVLGVLEEEYASSRIVGESHSSIVDLPLTDLIDGTLLSVSSWYDNEMGYAHRLAEVAVMIAKRPR